MIKVLSYVIASVAFLALAIVVTGYLLPEKHSASVRAHYTTAPQELYNAIVDVESGAQWRTGLDSVQVLASEPLRWREFASWGNLTMVMDEATSPSRVVSRIADQGEGFGGIWTYQIVPDATGATVTITEDGEVYNPLFRFMSKFVIGHYKSLETYAADLGRKFNQTVVPERVQRAGGP